MAHSSQQNRRDVVNLQRMLDRLEETTFGGPSKDNIVQERSTDLYYQILGMLANIKNARQLLQDNVNNAQVKSIVSQRLDRLEHHYETLRQNTPPPEFPADFIRPSVDSLRPKLVVTDITLEKPEGQPEAIAATTDVDNTSTATLPNIVDDLIPDDDDTPVDPLRTRRHSSFSGSNPVITPLTSSTAPESTKQREVTPASTRRPSGPSPATTESLTTLLSHHRSEQDMLTEELAQMSSRLKLNSLQFSDMLASDKALLENAEQKLDNNLGGMTKERERLKGYSKKGGVTTWFVIGAVAAVMLAWMFMFGIMRVL